MTQFYNRQEHTVYSAEFRWNCVNDFSLQLNIF